jgi:uncharacterized integral membrane protein
MAAERGSVRRHRRRERAAVYAFFAYLTFTVIAGRQRSQSREQQDITAKVMQHPGGQWLVGFAGLIVVIIGAVLAVEGIRRKFMKYLRSWEMSRRTRRIVEVLGTAGTIARGLVFALAGILVIDAAVTHRPSKSGGIDKALLTLRNQPFGEVLLLLAALGLLIFGVYGLSPSWRTRAKALAAGCPSSGRSSRTRA